MRNLLLTLSFDGTNYCGWQIQPNGDTVQQRIQDACSIINGEATTVTGCSRTDSGVHANNFCCTFKTQKDISCEKFIYALNGNLPDDIAVKSCREVPESFHPRYACTKKEYIYRIYNSRLKDPFEYKYSLQYKRPIDENLLNEAAKRFMGTYDFKGFCSVGSSVDSTVRTIYNADVKRHGDMIVFSVCGNGFLYNMVRIMTGTLLAVAENKISKDDIVNIILSGDRNNAGITAPAKGLFLNKVYYGGECFG